MRLPLRSAPLAELARILRQAACSFAENTLFSLNFITRQERCGGNKVRWILDCSSGRWPAAPGFGNATARTGIFVALMFTALAGCGFQLRGWDLESSVASIHLDVQPRIRFAQPLRQALRQAGVRIEPRAADAELVLALIDERRERRTVAVTGSARAAEYEITLGIRYAIRAGGRELREPQWLDASRVFAVDRDNIAGTAGEQALIEAELENDLVQQLMRALNAVAVGLVPPEEPDAD